MKKKILSLFLCLTMILSICIPAAAAGASLTASVTKTTICTNGTTTVTVHLNSTEAVKVLGVQVEFDDSLLTLTNAYGIASGSVETMLETYDNTKNTYAAMLKTAGTVNIDILSLTFKTTSKTADTAVITLTPSMKNGSSTIDCAAKTVTIKIHDPKAAVKENEIAATCCAGGSYDEVVYCSVCGNELSREGKNTGIDKNAHKWGNWVETKAATEEATGTEKRTCENDPSHYEERDIPVLAHVHNMTEHKAVQATCTTSGNRLYYECTKCRRLFTDINGNNETTLEEVTVAAYNHNIIQVQERAATCTQKGMKAHYMCSRCGTLYTDKAGKNVTTADKLYTDVLGHKISAVAMVPATCTTPGTKAHYKCERCGALFEDADGKSPVIASQLRINALGHNYENGVCTRCGATQSNGGESGRTPQDYDIPEYQGSTGSGNSGNSGSTGNSGNTNNGSGRTTPDIRKYNITIGTDSGNGSVLSWDKLPGADSYRLYVKINGSYVYLKDLGTSTNVDVVLSTSGKYYVFTGGSYTVYTPDKDTGKLKKTGTLSADKIGTVARANNVTEDFMIKYVINGTESKDNNSYTASVKIYYKPALKVTAENGYIRIKWNKVPGATKYRLYKYTDNGKLKRLVETTKRSVRINNVVKGQTYTYAVRAYVNGKWTKVYKSDLVSITAK